MREDVDRTRLVALLVALGKTFRRPGRLYLAGGESMVWRGLRGTTRDRLVELTDAAIAEGGDRSLRFDPERVRRHLVRVLEPKAD